MSNRPLLEKIGITESIKMSIDSMKTLKKVLYDAKSGFEADVKSGTSLKCSKDKVREYDEAIKTLESWISAHSVTNQ